MHLPFIPLSVFGKDRKRSGRIFYEWRYLILSMLVLIFAFLYTVNGHQGSDFWEHTAVVKELAAHPVNPVHPQLSSNAPHEFYSPYMLCVAFIPKTTGLSPATALNIAGILNLLLLLIFLRRFISSLLGEKESKTVSFYALLFMLILWGTSPWSYSGFFHIKVIGKILSYPSTFSFSIMLLAFSIYIDILKKQKYIWFAPLLILSCVLLLTHPLTALVTFTGFLVFSISFYSHRNIASYILLGIMTATSFLLILKWPYYPFIEMMRSLPPEMHESNRTMYLYILQRTFPSLIGLPLLVIRLRKNRRDPLALFFIALAALYIYGAVSGKWSYGRVISYMVILLQLTIADWFGNMVLERRSGRPIPVLAYKGMIVLILLCALNTLPAAANCLPRYKINYNKYSFLSDYTGQYDVILSDIKTSWKIPAFGGKAVAAIHPLVFIKDNTERKKDMRRFFSDNTSVRERWNTINRYDVKYVLLNKRRITLEPNTINSIMKMGKPVYSNNDLVLIRVKN